MAYMKMRLASKLMDIMLSTKMSSTAHSSNKNASLVLDLRNMHSQKYVTTREQIISLPICIVYISIRFENSRTGASLRFPNQIFHQPNFLKISK